MNYFICQDWKSTSGNHAGMVHLCKEVEKIDPANNRVIIIRKNWDEVTIIRRFRKYIYRFDLYKLIYIITFISLVTKIKKNDRVFLMEYMDKERNQHIIAKCIRIFLYKEIKIYGLAHLFPEKLEKMFVRNEMQIWSNDVNYILTFGYSLSKYLKTRGVDEKKIITTFHYVDKNYYQIEFTDKPEESRLGVIAMGSFGRNYDLLVEIIKSLPHIDFHICKGFASIDELFAGLDNVKLYGYLSEEELKDVICKSDISLNVMKDTIGSNVITTSMSMGLAMVVSDVGSIRDYCQNSNTFFCKTMEDFISAILKLDKDRELLRSMRMTSLKISENLDIPTFYEHLKKW